MLCSKDLYTNDLLVAYFMSNRECRAETYVLVYVAASGRVADAGYVRHTWTEQYDSIT